MGQDVSTYRLLGVSLKTSKKKGSSKPVGYVSQFLQRDWMWHLLRHSCTGVSRHLVGNEHSHIVLWQHDQTKEKKILYSKHIYERNCMGEASHLVDTMNPDIVIVISTNIRVPSSDLQRSSAAWTASAPASAAAQPALLDQRSLRGTAPWWSLWSDDCRSRKGEKEAVTKDLCEVQNG